MSSSARVPACPSPSVPRRPVASPCGRRWSSSAWPCCILVVFVTIGILSSQSPTPVRHGGRPELGPRHRTAGPSRQRQRSRPSSAPVQPPTNILNAVFVPVGSVPISHRDHAAQARSIRLPGRLPVRRLPGRAAGVLCSGHAAAGLAGLRPRAGGQPSGLPRGAGQAGRYGRLLLGDGRGHLADDVPSRWSAPGQTDFTLRLLQVGDSDVGLGVMPRAAQRTRGGHSVPPRRRRRRGAARTGRPARPAGRPTRRS